MTLESTNANGAIESKSLLDEGYEPVDGGGQGNKDAAKDGGKDSSSKEAGGEGQDGAAKKEADQAAQAKAAEEKRLLEAKDEDLSDEDKAKKAEIVKAKEAKEKQGAPEKYETFKLPEGLATDTEANEEFCKVAKELNLSQDNAQRVLDLGVKQVQKAVTAVEKAIRDEAAKAFETFTQEWMAETKRMLGSNYQKELAFVSKAIAAPFSPEEAKAFRDIMRNTGAANHPLVVKLLHYYGKRTSEDRVTQQKQGEDRKSDGEIFYPNMVKK